MTSPRKSIVLSMIFIMLPLMNGFSKTGLSAMTVKYRKGIIVSPANKQEREKNNLFRKSVLVRSNVIRDPIYPFGMYSFLTTDNSLSIDRKSVKPDLSVDRVAVEFIAGEVGGLLTGLGCGLIGYLIDPSEGEYAGFRGFAYGAFIGFPIGSAYGVYVVGTGGKETGSYPATLLGCTIGVLAGVGIVSIFEEFDGAYAVPFLLPVIGGIIGFNQTRRWDDGFNPNSMIDMDHRKFSCSFPKYYLSNQYTYTGCIKRVIKTDVFSVHY